MSLSSAEKFNRGLLNASGLKKLRLNFCLNRRELLVALMPSLTNPELVPLLELNLAANGLTDLETGELVSRIVIKHCEYRD